MKEVLKFINNASLAQLAVIPGIQEALAESLIAARPFTAVEDVLKVKGIGPNLYSRIEAAAESANLSEDTDPRIPEVSITVPTYDAPMKSYEPVPPKPIKTGAFIGRFMRSFFRVLLWLVVIAGIVGAAGAAIYYGLPFIQRTFIDPLNANTTQIDEITAQQAEDLAALDEKISTINTRLDQIESDLVAKDEGIAQLAEDLTALEESTLAGQQALDTQLREEIVISYSLELIDRARLYLAQSNFGLAREDIQMASERLSNLLGEVDAARGDQLTKVIDRLDTASSMLPEYPVVAANDLEIAWFLLIEETL